MKTFIAMLGLMMMAAVACLAQVQDGQMFGDPRNERQPVPQETVVISDPASAVKELKAKAVKAIAAFRAAKTAKEMEAQTEPIISFADMSSEVQVEMGPKVLPWVDDAANQKYAPLLMAAFVAGEVKSQLDAHKAKDDPMAGALQVIETYQTLKKQDATLRIPSIEQWIALQAQGKLRAEVEAAATAKP